MIATLLALVGKDLRLFARDRTAVVLTFLLPLALGSVFGVAMTAVFGGGSGPKVRVAVGFEDLDGSERSRSLLAGLEAAEGLEVKRVEDVRRAVASGRQGAGLLVPEGWGVSAEGGEPRDLILYRDPGQFLTHQVVLFKLAPVLMAERLRTFGPRVPGQVLDLIDFPGAGREQAEGLLTETYQRMEDLILSLAEAQPSPASGDAAMSASEAPRSLGFDPQKQIPRLLGLETQDVTGRSEGRLPRSAGPSHAFSAMAVMMLLFSVVSAGGTLLQEQREGTLTRLQLTPAAGRAILGGKLIVLALIAVAQLAVLFGFGALVFAVPVLDHLGSLMLVTVVWALLGVSIGILFAVACRTQKQLEGLSTLLILVLSAVGGAWFPREITPAWFQAVGAVTPVAWAMDAFHGVLWYGKGLWAGEAMDGLWPDVLKMLLGATVLLALAGRLYRARFVAGV